MKKIAIVGAGGQALAHAKCLLEESWDVKIYNRNDDYKANAIRDGLNIRNIEEGIKEKIIYLLVGDDVHGKVYEKFIKPFETKDTLVIIAHSYSYYSKTFKPSKDISVAMIAPRMPGAPIIKAKLEGRGVPAFWDVIQGNFDLIKAQIMEIAEAIGYTKSKFKHVPWEEETEVDLFIEQYFLPRLLVLIEQTFDYLKKIGFKDETALYELFQSGELGMLLTEASSVGLLETWIRNASPTCRFGLNEAILKIRNEVEETKIMENALQNIKNGKFLKRLNEDTEKDMELTKEMERNFLSRNMSQASKDIRSQGLI